MHRQAGLDLIRASAIVWVMIYHASLLGLISADATLVRFGWMGVDLFFVLSGFLIAGQLLRPLVNDESPNFRRFFYRRLLRTVPAYVAVLFVYLAFPDWRERPVIQPLWQFLSFTQNLFIQMDAPKAFSHAWSLCVEEQFYVLLPCVILATRRRVSAGGVISILVVVCFAGMLVRGALWLALVGDPRWDLGASATPRAFMEWIYYPTWSRLDGLLAGVALALIQAGRPAWWIVMERRGILMTVLGVLGIGVSILFFQDQLAPFWASVLGYPLLAFSMALIIAAGAITNSPIGRLCMPGARIFAKGAYSLYLSHKMVFHSVQVAAAAHGQTGPIVTIVAFCLAFLVGATLFFCIERPFLQLRDRGAGSVPKEGPSARALAPPR